MDELAWKRLGRILGIMTGIVLGELIVHFIRGTAHITNIARTLLPMWLLSQ